jgi:hypothetical protein
MPPGCSEGSSRRRSGGRRCAALLAVYALPWTAALGVCKLGKLAEFPITMVNSQPTMTAKINDREVQFVVDSGAAWSTRRGGRSDGEGSGRSFDHGGGL